MWLVHQYTVFVQTQLFSEDIIVFHRGASFVCHRSINNQKQDFRSLSMLEELVAEAAVLVGTLNDAG